MGGDAIEAVGGVGAGAIADGAVGAIDGGAVRGAGI
jgi:hypothetical protein